MAKKQTGMRMDADAFRRLKIWAAETDDSVGGVVEKLVQFVEQRAEQRRELLRKAGLTTYLNQPTLSLGLMADSTIQSLLDMAQDQNAPRQDPEWGDPHGDDW